MDYTSAFVLGVFIMIAGGMIGDGLRSVGRSIACLADAIKEQKPVEPQKSVDWTAVKAELSAMFAEAKGEQK